MSTFHTHEWYHYNLRRYHHRAGTGFSPVMFLDVDLTPDGLVRMRAPVGTARHGVKAKARGLLHSEGNDYLLQDGDAVVFRFNA